MNERDKPDEAGAVDQGAASEPEITPEMVEAGVLVLDRFEGAYDLWMLAAAAYRAMSAAKPQQRLLASRTEGGVEAGLRSR